MKRTSDSAGKIRRAAHALDALAPKGPSAAARVGAIVRAASRPAKTRRRRRVVDYSALSLRATVRLPSGAELRVHRGVLNGRDLVSVRLWFEVGTGTWRPTHRGFVVDASAGVQVVEAVLAALPESMGH